MKKLLITLIGALSLGAALPAVAGPDWQAIEAARKAKQATQIARHAGPDDVQGPTAAASSPKDPYAALPPTGAGPQKCPTDALVLPLDHGPRAQTTPYQNQLRRDRYAAQLTACKQSTK